MFINKKPELLAPAGDPEKLEIAFAYGADSVYLGADCFGLRQAANSFSLEDIAWAVKYAKKLSKKIYITVNVMAKPEEISKLPKFLKELDNISPSAIIVSDFGILKLARELTSLECHISTQASVCNSKTIKFWQNAGARRIILARESSLKDLKELRKNTNCELEVFIHGAMCIAYSGKCIISNFIAKRDANSGGCIQSCRYPYIFYQDKGAKAILKNAIPYMSSRDLMAIEDLKTLIELGIDSFKIEGRMKSKLYLANTVSTYRQAIDTLSNIEELKQQLSMVSNRNFCRGFLHDNTMENSLFYENNYKKEIEFLGSIITIKNDNCFLLEVKKTFSSKTELLILTPEKRSWTKLNNFSIETLDGTSIKKTKPNTVIIIKSNNLKLSKNSVIGRRI